LGIPAYGGRLFSSDGSISKAGEALSKIIIPNAIFKKVLFNLLLTDTKEGDYVPIDFRSLSVREFGTIYEGLLESELSIAEDNLTIDKKGIYKPTEDNKSIIVKKGEVYLHDRSGTRKSSGSFFTPEFLVEYILDKSLEPAIDEHLENLNNLNEVERTEEIFNFRVADIAMGSGHFLVAAIDRIENKFSSWLEDNPTPGIIRELNYLKASAKKTKTTKKKVKKKTDKKSLPKKKSSKKKATKKKVSGKKKATGKKKPAKKKKVAAKKGGKKKVSKKRGRK